MARPRNAQSVTDFAAPLTVPPGDGGGAFIAREVSPDLALPLWQALRSVLMWAAEEPAMRASLFEASSMVQWERELLEGEWEPDLRMPLAVLVGELGNADKAIPGEVARVCLVVVEWALDQGATATALAFAEAAALAWPQSARYAWTTGRLLRSHGRLPEAGALAPAGVPHRRRHERSRIRGACPQQPWQPVP